LVKGEEINIENVHVHILGGVALMRAWCPMPDQAAGGIRGLFQLSYTMFVSAHMTGTTLPPAFHDWIAFGRSIQPEVDYPSTDLGVLIVRFVDLSAAVRNTTFKDGQSSTSSMIRKLVELEQELASWEQSLQGPWLYRVATDPGLPPQAVFEGEYHIYQDMWVARIWNHYRWARLLVNQIIVELKDKYPVSAGTVEGPETSQQMDVIHRLGRDILVSIPAHWRHPLLGNKMPLTIDKQGGAGAGAAGIIIVIFQLKAVACSPGFPEESWNWIQDVLRCIWSDMGMLHAKNVMQEMQSMRSKVQTSQKWTVVA
jgi:hypothetical protein